MSKYILAINPGSTSTKVALYEGETLWKSNNFVHSAEDLAPFSHVMEQRMFRKNVVLEWMKGLGLKDDELIAVVGRGGLMRSIPSGCYEVDELMLSDMEQGIRGEHASNLGSLIANEIAHAYGVKPYIVDPVSVDEFMDISRISGIPQIVRKSMVHALNCRAMAHRYMRENHPGERLEERNLIIAHMGGGISVVPMYRGKMIDANNANEMGPFSSERTGGLPVGDLVELCFSGRSASEVKTMLRGKGGVYAYLGTTDLKAIEEKGDPNELKILEAMAYQVAKEIGGAAASLNGNVDAIILTGGVAYSTVIVPVIKEMTSFIAKVVVMPGEDELLALASGVNRVLQGIDEAKNYTEVAN